MKLSYYKDPFPHMIGSLDSEFYDKVNSSWGNVNHTEYVAAAGNRSNIPVTDKEIINILGNIILNSHSTFQNDYHECYTKLLAVGDFKANIRLLYSENVPSETAYKIRGLHLDTGDKHLIGLWYFKHPEEIDCGGDLVLMNPITKESKIVKYDSNVFVIFPNVMTAWHAVTPRKPSKYPRRYINLLLESPDVKLHNYQRSGSTVDDEFRGKLINYYN